MRVVLQRVRHASVAADGVTSGSIGPGLVALVAIAEADTAATVTRVAHQTAHLRLFPAGGRSLELSLIDTGHACLVVSQFTLLADTSRGRRPSFFAAAPPDRAADLVAAFAGGLAALGLPVAHGVFGAHMELSLVNDGPVTLILEA